jgi:hypothetical protein
MAMNGKKAFLFSIFVITALSLVVLTYKTRVQFKEEQRAEIFQDRIEQINLFIEDFESDIDRSLYVTSFRAFIGIDEYVNNRQEYLPSDTLAGLEDYIIELIMNGTIDGTQLNSTNASTLNDWLTEIKILAQPYRLNLTLPSLSLSVQQVSPWEIEVRMDANVSMDLTDQDIGWNYTLSKFTIIDLEESRFADPIYFVESTRNNPGEKPLINNIRKTPYEVFWSNQSDYINVTNLTSHVLGQYYRNNSDAPSFFMRLLGGYDCEDPGFSDHCQSYGIESFVNVINNSKIFDYSDEGSATCALDHQFFFSGCEEMHRIENMHSRFYVGNDTLFDYNLTEINST